MCTGTRPLPCPLATVISLIACSVSSPPPAGDPPAPTFHEQIEPIVQRHCVRCHSPGGIAPFALTSYDGVKPHAAACAVAVRFGLMPPWPPSPAGVPLIDDPTLSEEEKATFWRWIQTGATEGSVANHDPYLPPQPEIRAD